MLNSITIKNCFAHVNSTFDLTAGLTAVTGPNFSGKSQILEMARFALFGTEALRTKADDYKEASISLNFTVRGVDYTVERTTKKAKLTSAEGTLAVGTRPVNLKIIEIFGYGLAVFDVANCATQGNIEAMSAMRAADRKKLVDSTVGLNVIDELAAYCTEEASARAKTIEGMSEVLVEPVAPEKPEGYRPLAEVLAEREQAQAEQRELGDLTTKLASRPVATAPEPCPEKRSLSELEAISRQRALMTKEKARLEAAVRAVPVPTYTAEQIDDMEVAWGLHDGHKFALGWLASHPVPAHTATALDAMEAQLHEWDRWHEWTHLQAKGHHECPACKHKWPIAEIPEELGDWTGKPEPPRPVIRSLIAIIRARDEWHSHVASLHERETYEAVITKLGPKVADPPRVTMRELAQHKALLGNSERRAALEAELAGVVIPEDVSSLLATRAAWERAQARYEHDLARLQEWEAQVPAWTARVAEIGAVADRLQAAIQLQVEVQTYDRMRAIFEKEHAYFVEMSVRVEVLRQERLQFVSAKAALAEIKARVKTFLLPSLSRVATMILTSMTGGRLGAVQIDEDFEITVGGVVLDGLSGAGKAAANIALRIGLGQVLTNKVFSVFMADEIDAAMDADNAQSTAESLRNLTANISQIILVSHKTPEADHYIRL